MSSTEAPAGLEPGEDETLPALTRSPHPYHHQSFELPHLSSRFALRAGSADSKLPQAASQQPETTPRQTSFPPFSKESSPASDSGTEADDEHFLKGLPAPKVKLHKGLRGRGEPLSDASTPLPSPVPSDVGLTRASGKPPSSKGTPEDLGIKGLLHKHRVLVRRALEAGIVATLGLMVWTNSQVAPSVNAYASDLNRLSILFGTLVAAYPLQVVAWDYRNERSLGRNLLQLPATFDPAPLLYPPAITLFVSLLVSISNPAVILPNIVLSICAMPRQILPVLDENPAFDVFHWALTALPLVWGGRRPDPTTTPGALGVSDETLVLLYPLHITLCFVLHYLTTTSLLTAELQLLSIALINVLILASSPQVQILQALLWVGGLGVLILCGPVIRWGIALARVPKWRFYRGPAPRTHHLQDGLNWIKSWGWGKHEFFKSTTQNHIHDAQGSSEDEPSSFSPQSLKRVRTLGAPPERSPEPDSVPSSPNADGFLSQALGRRHTLPYLDVAGRTRTSYTPSGRPKRAISVSARPFLKLTQGQAAMRKWIYAIYVYICIAALVLVGIRAHIQHFALNGNEPIGWALGYFFGNIPWFRFEVVKANLGSWICLPSRPEEASTADLALGWVQQIRHFEYGEANTRLILSGYWVIIVAVGLLVVFQLQDTFEVDTRRKVFHFTMVGMLLPATYIDPTFAGLALSIVLAIFLFLDLLRASQLPPLSKPIASFLAPYVDGRDFRGPVVISHIFLLIGCAIPLWLALASLPRTGSGYLAGWEVPTREVSMVSGVICVGLGDAAASLIGRRYGHRKWLWGGGKSLEGSVAMAAAVFAGLVAASAWLHIGQWPSTSESTGMWTSIRNAGVCASMSSLTEAVLTGGNDNVIVPVVLWTCVKSIGI
ncbi:hypothetical protein S40293_03531 [Stachybotrys chartarum IBT 40293]|nr:hypothetical protein S40293_03531 [Stachybotrys chartarum IBT 40293]